MSFLKKFYNSFVLGFRNYNTPIEQKILEHKYGRIIYGIWPIIMIWFVKENILLMENPIYAFMQNFPIIHIIIISILIILVLFFTAISIHGLFFSKILLTEVEIRDQYGNTIIPSVMMLGKIVSVCGKCVGGFCGGVGISMGIDYIGEVIGEGPVAKNKLTEIAKNTGFYHDSDPIQNSQTESTTIAKIDKKK